MDWATLKVADLRTELTRRSLDRVGVKQELVRRLTEDDSNSAAGNNPDMDGPEQLGGEVSVDSLAVASNDERMDANHGTGASCDLPTMVSGTESEHGHTGLNTIQDAKRKRRSISPAPDHRRVKPREDPDASTLDPTRALHISGFLRPPAPETLRTHLHALVNPFDQGTDDDAIELFHLDHVKTHAFVIFNETAQAIRARSAFQQAHWPCESARRPLRADFVPARKVRDWIAEEERAGSGKADDRRWEARYGKNEEGNATTAFCARPSEGSGPLPHHSQAPLKQPSPLPAPQRNFNQSAAGNVNTIPLGTRMRMSSRLASTPLGRPYMPGTSDLDTPHVSGLTLAKPAITWEPVPRDLALRRLEALRFHYTKRGNRDLGREDEIDRYTFEAGSVFVDRGVEVFVGIRPPHRERARNN